MGGRLDHFRSQCLNKPAFRRRKEIALSLGLALQLGVCGCQCCTADVGCQARVVAVLQHDRHGNAAPPAKGRKTDEPCLGLVA
jgi:hypothetical protein